VTCHPRHHTLGDPDVALRAPMISDDEIDALSDDPETAFVQYEAIIRAAVRSANSQPGYQGFDVERDYVAHVLAFVDTRDLPLELPRNPPTDDQHFWDWYQNFLRAVDYFKVSARLRIAERKKEHVSVLRLSVDFKTQIGGHLTAIRKIVMEANISENKRDAILKRVSKLQWEVDRDRTRTDAAMALWMDLTNAISKGAENLDPAIDRLERIFKVFANAKDENEQQALMAPREMKRIGAPTGPQEPAQEMKRIAAPTTELDDEIPF
jgi:hypothetical protein